MKSILIAIMLTTFIKAQTQFDEINKLEQSGNFSKAIKMIDDKLANKDISFEEMFQLQYEKERLDRIKKDFNKTSEDVLKFVNKYYQNAKEKDLEKWENDGSLQYKIIDGKKWYFSRAASNLFRI
nr:transglutaminase domain-containing protein [Ignavibacterium sp.]